MLDCTDVEKLIKKGADKKHYFVRLVLLTQWHLDCLKQIEDESRERFPKEQETILFDNIKAELKRVKIRLIQLDMRDLKFIGVVLRDYEVGENVDFNKFLIESLFSSYKSISEIMSKKVKSERKKNPFKPNIPQEFIEFLKVDVQTKLDQYLDSSKKPKIDSYLNTRRDADSLYTIYTTIGSIEPTFKGKDISIETKRLALQRLFHITGEYLKDTTISPNLSSDVKQSLEEKGVPTKALSKYRDMLAHYQVFPLIQEDNDQVNKLFDECFLAIQEVIKSQIIETEGRFVQNILAEKQGKSVVERLIESKSTEGVHGLQRCIGTIKSEDTYRSMSDETKKFVDEIYQTVRRMKSVDFLVDSVEPSESEVSEKKPNLSDSIIAYINKTKLKVYDKLRDEVRSSLDTYLGGIENPHSDVVKIAEVIDRLSYKDRSSPNNSILDDFLSLPILENIYVKIKKGTDNEKVIGSLKNQLERYFDEKSFKNNDAYSEFKDNNLEKLIDLLNNFSGKNDNKKKLIAFFESIGKSKDNYILPEKYEGLVKGLGIGVNSEEKLYSYSVSWREQKCADLLQRNPPALKTIYDNIVEGKKIDSSVYNDLAVEYKLPDVPQNNEEERVRLINQKVEELYTSRTRDEFELLTEVNDPYAVESQIINIYSLSEKAIDKKKENKNQNSGEEKKFEIKKLRNYLSHGDPLISIEDHKYIARQLVKVKNSEDVIGMLKDRNITPEKIEASMDVIPERVGLKKIRKLICPSGQSRRSTRSASESCLTWEEIDKFNEGGAENRDPDNIIIDSEKFLSIISSELEANGEKFSNFIALASESEVTGDHTSKVNMLTENHRYNDHLERVGKVSGMVMHGMIAKNLVGDLLRGDYKDLAINLGFLAGSPVLAKVAKTVSMEGAKSILKGSEMLGKSLKFASPFISRGVSGFIAWDLFTQVEEYRKGDKDALVSIVGDSVQIAMDAAEIGIEIAEAFGVLEGVSSATGPIGMVVAAVIFVGTDIYMAVRTVEKIDEVIHLTEGEKFIEGLRAFIGLGPSHDIEKLIEEKEANNQAVLNAAIFLQDHQYIQKYVFPSMKLNNDEKMEEVLSNIVFLDEKKNDIKWTRTRPDNRAGIDLFCLPKGDWEYVPDGTTYYCDGAIGVKYPINRTGNNTLIRLGDGYDDIKGCQGSSNIFVSGDGYKQLTGGNKDDNFIFGGKSVDAVSDSNISAFIDGGGGIDRIDVSQLTPHYEESKGVGRYQVSADFRKGYVKDTSKVFLQIRNINVFLGRKGGVDQVVSACDTKHVDARGGENKNYLDSIIIPKDDACSYDMTVTVNPYTRVTNDATSGNFLYFVKGEKGKEAYIELGSSSQINNTFTFNYTLTDVAAIDKSDKNITFSFVEEFYKNEKKLDMNSSFNLTVSGADQNTTMYYLIDRTKLLIGQNNVYAMQSTEKPIDSLVKNYSSAADKSQMYVVVDSNNEVLAIGHGHGDVLPNDPNAKTSHLVGGGGEDVFVISSGYEKLTLANLPISDVVIYDFYQEDKIDTLDLRGLKKQLKKDIDREMNIEISKIGSDLLINLSLDDASKEEVVKIRLKDALQNNWYKRVHIVLDSIFVIKEILNDFELTPQPLIFDDNSISMYVINPTDVAEVSKIRVKKEIGDYIFARDYDALVLTNSLSSSTNKNNLFTIIFNDFYYGNNRAKMQSLKIEFNDQKILLRKEIERINDDRNFIKLMKEVRIDRYKAVMYAIKEQKLFEAIEENNIREVKDLINHGVSIDARNNDGQNPLQSAAKSGNLEVVKYLIEEKGANVNVKDGSGKQILHYAVISGNLEVVKYLIDEKVADVDVKDDSGKQTLHYAVISGNLEIVKYLIEEKGANVNAEDGFHRVPLHLATEYNRLEIVKYLIEEKGADVNVMPHLGTVSAHFITVHDGNIEGIKFLTEENGVAIDVGNLYKKVPLHYAAKGGSLEMVKYLVEEKGANINAEDAFFLEPLHFAAEYNRLEVVKYLIEEKGVDANEANACSKLPLQFAAHGGNLEVVKYLVEKKGADVDRKNDFGMVALHYAVMSGNLEVVKYLIEEKGSNAQERDLYKRVPLHLAAHYNRLEVEKYLIEEKAGNGNETNACIKLPLHFSANGANLEIVKYLIEVERADFDASDESGQRTLHYAVNSTDLEVVKYLIEERGANVNFGDDNAETPLFYAAKGGNPEIVKHLIERGAYVNARNKHGYTPWQYAVTNGRLEVVKYLIEEGGVNVNVGDDNAKTPLFYAIEIENVKMVQYLIEKGARIDLKTNGETPLNILENKGYTRLVDIVTEKLTQRLFDAVKYDDLGEVQDLIDQGVSVNLKDSDGQLLLHFATINGKVKVVKYLLGRKDVDVNVKNEHGQTCLYLAVTNGMLGLVKYLVEEKGAHVDIKDNMGTTPLHTAAIKGSLEIVRCLVEKGNANVNVRDGRGLVPLQYVVMMGNAEIVEYLTDTKDIDLNVTDFRGRKLYELALIKGHRNLLKYFTMKVDGLRIEPRLYKRSPHQSSRRLLTTDLIDRPEIATNNASEKSLLNSIVKLQENSTPSEAASSNHPIRHERRKRHNDHSSHEDGMRMQIRRVRHRHRRVQKRNVKYQDSHGYIDQPEIATSSGTRPSSWINALLDWVKEKGVGLVSSVADKFTAKELEDFKSTGNHVCSVGLEKMYSATVPNIPQSRKSQGVPKGNIANTSWSSNWEKVTSNVTDAPEMNIILLNNALMLGDLAVRFVNGTRYKQPIHENLLSLREKSMRFIDENMIMETIQRGKEKFGGLDTNMDV